MSYATVIRKTEVSLLSVQENQLNHNYTEPLWYYHNWKTSKPYPFFPTDTFAHLQTTSKDWSANKAETGRKMVSRLGTLLCDGCKLLGQIMPFELPSALVLLLLPAVVTPHSQPRLTLLLPISSTVAKANVYVFPPLCLNVRLTLHIPSLSLTDPGEKRSFWPQEDWQMEMESLLLSLRSPLLI